jgi:hypothetical protein
MGSNHFNAGVTNKPDSKCTVEMKRFHWPINNYKYFQSASHLLARNHFRFNFPSASNITAMVHRHTFHFSSPGMTRDTGNSIPGSPGVMSELDECFQNLTPNENVSQSIVDCPFQLNVYFEHVGPVPENLSCQVTCTWNDDPAPASSSKHPNVASSELNDPLPNPGPSNIPQQRRQYPERHSGFIPNIPRPPHEHMNANPPQTRTPQPNRHYPPKQPQRPSPPNLEVPRKSSKIVNSLGDLASTSHQFQKKQTCDHKTYHPNKFLQVNQRPQTFFREEAFITPSGASHPRTRMDAVQQSRQFTPHEHGPRQRRNAIPDSITRSRGYY